jgi:3-oxoacyl-[acyl-carrier protein] reductase
MEYGLEDKVALICGASRGIGEACARALAGEGARTILLSRNEKRLQQVVQDIVASGGEARYVCADLSDIALLEDVAGQAQNIYGKVDILVNNTGGPPSGDNFSFSNEIWEESFRATFMSAMVLTKALLLPMAERGWGRVINLTSVTVKQPIEGLILSNSIRTAVVGWAKTLSHQFASNNVTINNIATGYTLTERVRIIARERAEREGVSEEAVLQKMIEGIPMKRMATPDEIGSLALFLAGECSSYITGVTIPIDGGFTTSVL